MAQIEYAASRKFKDMGAGEKVVFIGKFMVFVLTMGFAFPTILNDPEYRGGTRQPGV